MFKPNEANAYVIPYILKKQTIMCKDGLHYKKKMLVHRLKAKYF